MLSCCKLVKLQLHFIAQIIKSVIQCGVTGAEDFAEVKKRGSHRAKLLALSTQARCRVEPAMTATVSLGSHADDRSTWDTT